MSGAGFMAPFIQAEAELFEKEAPSPEVMKKLWLAANSSERSRMALLEKARSSENPLACGLAYLFCGQASQAAETLAKAPDSVQKYLGLGYAYRQMKQYDKAIESFDKAVQYNADPMMAGMEKAATYRTAGELEKAAQTLSEFGSMETVSAEYHFQTGKLMDAMGEYEKAMQNYQTALELDPAHGEARFALAFACDLRGDEEAAIRHYQELVQQQPTHVNALLNLAVLYEDIGEYEQALECVETVLRSHPNHPKARLFQKDIASSKVMVYDEEREKRKDRQSKILEIPISDFELSVRSRNCLKKMNIDTLGDLLRTTEADLLSYKNFGETSLTEIKRILESKGLRLGMALEEKPAGTPEPPEISGANPEVLSKSVDELELSVRGRQAMARLGVKTLLDLIGKTEAELLGCKNFGITSLNEVKEKLAKFGLSLRKLE
jgi:DNA-directed RNA polymerase subunit alpha